MAKVAVGIRLEREVWERHSAAAQSVGLPLGVYLRRCLEEHDRTASALGELKSLVERSSASGTEEGNGAGLPMGLFIEVLLILRQLAGPQRALIAQKEVERRGLDSWH
jgi:hypothetical protein